MASNDKAGLKQAFSRFRKPESDEEAELKLLGRTVEEPPASAPIQAPIPQIDPPNVVGSYEVAAARPAVHEPVSGLTPRPLLQREPERQLSFRCPVSLVAELHRKARYNQLEQQQILKEGLRRVLAELSDPPEGWVG